VIANAVERHVLALSGGWDSTCLAFELREREPRPYTLVCTPTGDEPDEMFAFWNRLGDLMGAPVLPVMNVTLGGLNGLIAHYGALPNHRQRWCTRRLKIEPYREQLKRWADEGPVTSYVGLRADETGRAGGAYDDIAGVAMRFPLREWGFDRARVVSSLEQRGVIPPDRTDCRRCYHQTLGEWWKLWRFDPASWASAVGQERDTGATFRSPRLHGDEPVMVTRFGLTFAACWRDTWPVRLADMQVLFERGLIPRGTQLQADLVRQSGQCRVCTI
jgi:hypothetical protein